MNALLCSISNNCQNKVKTVEIVEILNSESKRKTKMKKNNFIQDEHEKYFFGCCSSEVIYTLEESVKNCVRGLMEECKTALEENVCKNDLIAKEIAEMEALYMRCCMKVLDDFKSVIRDIFAIPENAAIYPERKTYTESEVESLRQEVSDLQIKFLREKMHLAHLKKEMEILEMLNPSRSNTKILLDKLEDQTELESANKIERINKKREDCARKLNLPIKIDESPILAEDLGLLNIS